MPSERPSRETASSPRAEAPCQPSRGTWLVAGLLLLGVLAAIGGIWFQRQQTRRCLDFYGSDAARRIASAGTVELVEVKPGQGPRSLVTASRIDVSHAAGMVHLRRGLVEDANFVWPGATTSDADGPQPTDSWDYALVFTDDSGRTAVVIDLDGPQGRLAVVGQPGRIGLGRIGRGLATWVRSTLGRPPAAGRTGADVPDSAAESR